MRCFSLFAVFLFSLSTLVLAGTYGNGPYGTGAYGYGFVAVDYSSGQSSSDNGLQVVPPVSNGTWTNTTNLTSNSLSLGTDVPLFPGQREQFEFNNETHFFGLINLTNLTATVQVESVPQMAILSIGQVKQFELSGDNYYDLSVKLNSIANGSANLTLKFIHEVVLSNSESANQTGATNTSQVPPVRANNSALVLPNVPIEWIVIVVVLLLVLGVYFFTRPKKRKGL